MYDRARFYGDSIRLFYSFALSDCLHFERSRSASVISKRNLVLPQNLIIILFTNLIST